MQIDGLPIPATPAEAYILQVLAKNGFEAGDGGTDGGTDGGSALANLGAIVTEQRPASTVVQSGDSLDITPTNFDVNDFGSLLTFDGGVYKTTNAGRLNLALRISVPIEDTQGTEETHLVYLQRGNETVPIGTTIASVKGRRFAQTTDAGLVLTYTSGPGDPFNNVGFRVVFQNDGLFPITVRAAEVRVDFFAVADPSDTAAPTG